MSDEGGDNYTDTDNVPSGAYIFKPSKDNPSSVPYFTGPSSMSTFSNEFMQETAFYFDDFALN
jgi:hypothetical protein